MSEEFLLKWNDHHSLFFVGAEELCESEEYTDVTLAAGNKFFPAHKLVLSICSPYFRQLFKRLGSDKSVIFLKDVDPKHLDLLLQYMYKGEIKVQETELVKVLSTAQALDIKGLSDRSSSNKAVPAVKSPKRPPPLSVIPGFEQNARKKQRTMPSSDQISEKGNSIQVPATPSPTPQPRPSQPELVSVKQEITPVTIDLDHGDGDSIVADEGGAADFGGVGQEMVYRDTSVVAGYEGEGGYEEGEYYDQGMGHQDDREGWELAVKPSATGTLFCSFCGKEYPHMSALKQHMPVHTGEKKFECKSCARRFTQSSSLYKHMKKSNCFKQDNGAANNLDQSDYSPYVNP